MMVANRGCTHRPHLTIVCAAISLSLFALAAPTESIAQIGSQTGYQEWAPPESGGGPADEAGGVDGGSGGAPGAAVYGSSGGAAYNGGARPAGGSRGSGTDTQSVDAAGGGGKGSALASPAGHPPAGRLASQRNADAAGTIPLTADNILLALAVGAVAIGTGFGVNRLARRTSGT